MRTRKRRLKRKTPFVIFCIIILALLAGGFTLARDMFSPGVDVDGDGFIDQASEEERLNVLLLGIDARKGETVARADTVILASVDPKTKQMALLSIPRDTRVNIPGHGWDKINSSIVYGGPEMSMRVASDLLGIPVKYYVQTNFGGFKDIVDALGGVTIDVERNMYHEDPDDGGAYQINLRKGVQRLNGEKALQYVRYRDYELGDIDRTKYQQKFLAALAREMLQPSTIPKLPKLVPEINKHVKTNLSVPYMVTMASVAKNLQDGSILTQTLPGRPVNINGGSYWGVDPSEARQTVARLFEGETVTNIVLTTPLSGKYAVPAESKPPVESKEDKPVPQSSTPYLPGAQTQQGQNSGKTQTKTGQSGTTKTEKTGGTTTGSGSVVITPADDDTGTDDPATTTKTGSGTSTTVKTGTSTGVNPSIPGSS